MREVGVVLGDQNQPIFWHLPEDRTVVHLPDSGSLWDIFREKKASITGYAHSHPGDGLPMYSYMDATTFAAIEDGLGRRIDWWVTSETHLIIARWVGPDRLSYGVSSVDLEPSWADELRERSGQQRREGGTRGSTST